MKLKPIHIILLAAFLIIYPCRSIAQTKPVYVVLFTHIEDNSPVGTMGSEESRIHFLQVRRNMIEMANLARKYNISWSFQPDWKILLAALMYEDSVSMRTTNGKNFLRYIKEDLGAIIDPHSHEKQGYNYTDVAYLLDSLGVGGSKIIGGHIWDPSIPNFQHWDRFRVPVRGTTYPWAIWRGEILMGSGSPNHSNDPIVSGVWRPKDRDNFFVDDPAGNISCVGQYKGDISSTAELIDLYKENKVPGSCMLTSSYHITPTQLNTDMGAVEDTVIKPLLIWIEKGEVIVTDFTTLISEWKTKFHSLGYIYDPGKATGIDDKLISSPSPVRIIPNPFSTRIILQNCTGEEDFALVNAMGQTIWAGHQIQHQDFTGLASGVYFLKINDRHSQQVIRLVKN
jgi:hypothetical protein